MWCEGSHCLFFMCQGTSKDMSAASIFLRVYENFAAATLVSGARAWPGTGGGRGAGGGGRGAAAVALTCSQARCMALLPALSVASYTAPCLSSSRTIAALPVMTAWCSGVRPSCMQSTPVRARQRLLERDNDAGFL